jgi:acyl-CoA reductase-like NAD-dependent aldehyde dehydrogenase
MAQTKRLIGGVLVVGKGAARDSEPATGKGDRTMPHSVKQSGYGKDMSIYGLEDYTVVRHVMVTH